MINMIDFDCTKNAMGILEKAKPAQRFSQYRPNLLFLRKAGLLTNPWSPTLGEPWTCPPESTDSQPGLP